MNWCVCPHGVQAASPRNGAHEEANFSGGGGRATIASEPDSHGTRTCGNLLNGGPLGCMLKVVGNSVRFFVARD